jgi:hypothetical protein
MLTAQPRLAFFNSLLDRYDLRAVARIELKRLLKGAV